MHRIEVRTLNPAPSPLVAQAHLVGVPGVRAVEAVKVFFLDGELDHTTIVMLTEAALCDDVVEGYGLGTPDAAIRPTGEGVRAIEVSPKPGVTDAVAETLLQAARQVGITGLRRTATAIRYEIHGDLDAADLDRLASGLLANDVVEQWAIDAVVAPPFPEGASPVHTVEHLPVRGLDDAGLLALSTERRLSLDLQEMTCVRAHFIELGREPTDLELEMLAQTWSEHCVHKTFRARIQLQQLDADGRIVDERIVDSMLKSFLKEATAQANKTWVYSAFVDNAGIVAFDEEFDLALKVETHNHPSALEPFGGANTGVGGCVRDVLGVSARPIANTDVLCFGPPDTTGLPDSVLHPRRIAAGVIKGIEDYGNKMGIPTVSGAIVYDPGYVANPLVFAGCIGLLPHGSNPTNAQAGDRVVVIGGRTGRDGLRGATFSSMEMTHETLELAGSAVQIGHPIHEKQVQEVICEARDAKLYTALTDCGAGGLSSSVGEMAAELGAIVHLERVPTKYPGLQPWEVWLSEAQERMVLAVPDVNWEALQEVCARHHVEATSIGRFTGDGVLTVKHGDTVVGELQTHFLHEGVPQRHLVATWSEPSTQAAPFTLDDPAAALIAMLGSDALCSRESIVRRYDHEVQGGTVVKPLVGVEGHGPGNGSVLVPLAARLRGRMHRGVALGCGINPAYGIDPYRMAWAAVDEAVRNVVVVGGDPDHLSLIDNFCWGNPKLPDRLGGLVRCGEGCRDAALAYNAPYISGKDSLNNEYAGSDGERRAIPGTLLITAMAIVPDVRFTATSDLKEAGNTVVLVGTTHGELGGSALFAHLGCSGDQAPIPVTDGLRIARAVHSALQTGFVRAAHDVSEGGIAVALAEMAYGGRLGVTVDLDALGTDLSAHRRAFGESSSRYLLTVRPDDLDAVLASLDVPYAILGTTGGEALVLRAGADYLNVAVDTVEAAARRL